MAEYVGALACCFGPCCLWLILHGGWAIYRYCRVAARLLDLVGLGLEGAPFAQKFVKLCLAASPSHSSVSSVSGMTAAPPATMADPLRGAVQIIEVRENERRLVVDVLSIDRSGEFWFLCGSHVRGREFFCGVCWTTQHDFDSRRKCLATAPFDDSLPGKEGSPEQHMRAIGDRCRRTFPLPSWQQSRPLPLPPAAIGLVRFWWSQRAEGAIARFEAVEAFLMTFFGALY